MTNETFLKVVDFLKENIALSVFQNKTYIVGGAVRDFFICKEIKDIDLVVEMPNGGIALGEFLTQKVNGNKQGLVVYPTYGTCKFTLNIPNIGKIEFEAVQTRKEWYTEGSRKPSAIAVGTIKEDAERRDLTINALYYNVSNDAIEDPTTHGKEDILQQIIRTPCESNQTYKDDPLRMLRVVRFASKLDWAIEKNTFQGIIKNHKLISTISQERITDEINKILLSEVPSNGIRLLSRCFLLKDVLPSVHKLIGVEQGEKYDTDVFEHTMNVLDKVKPILENRLCALFHDIAKPKTKKMNIKGEVTFFNHDVSGADKAKKILAKMKYSNKVIDLVTFGIESHEILKLYNNDMNTISNKSIRKISSTIDGKEDFLFDIIRANNTSISEKFNKPNQVDNLIKRMNDLKSKGEKLGKIKLPINGDDVMKQLNIKPSQMVKYYLTCVETAIMDNPNLTKEECLKIVQDKSDRLKNYD